MYLALLGDHGQHRLPVASHKGVACQQYPVAFPEKGNVPCRMAWSRNPAPVPQPGYRTVRRKQLYVAGDVNGLFRVEEGHVGHTSSSDAGVWRRIAGPAGQVGEFQRVSVYRHAPFLRQFLNGPHVVEVAVGEQNSPGAGTAKQVLHCGSDLLSRAEHTSIHQNP